MKEINDGYFLCPAFSARPSLPSLLCPAFSARPSLPGLLCPAFSARPSLPGLLLTLLALLLGTAFHSPPALAAPQVNSMAGGSDDIKRLTWTNSDGTFSYWRTAAAAPTSINNYGPYPGWNPDLVATGGNNVPRLLWDYTDGTMSLWNLTESSGAFTSKNYGPYTGWRAKAIAVGGNNIPRVMWDNTNGTMSLWTNADVSSAGPTFGPYSGYTASFLAVGPNNIPRVLWMSTSGVISLWANADTYATSPAYTNYGPFSGYTAIAMTVDSTNAPRILWNNSSGSLVSLWNVAANGTYTFVNFNYPAGFTPKALSAGSAGSVSILWTKSDGTVQIWVINSSGAVQSQTTYPSTYSLTLSPGSVTGGASSTGTVTLNSPALAGGTAVALSSSSPSATVPASVTVAAGSTMATFTVTTSPVGTLASATLTATCNGSSKSAVLTVNPAPVSVSALALSPTTVTGGSSSTGTVTLSGPARAGGSIVTLSSNSTSATVPASVTVGAGATSTTFTVSTTSVTTTTNATISAAASGAPQTAILMVTAAASLASPILSLTAAVNGQSSLGWTSVGSATSYNLYRSTTSGSGYTKILPNTTSLTYLDQGLTNGTPYYYCVTSVSSTGTESSYSNQVTSQPTAQAFGFLNVGNGAVLSGQVTLYVSMASQSYGSEASPVTFSVDGTVYDSGGDTQENSGNAGANTFFVLATDALANGPHTLSVADVNGNSSTVNVTFSNVLYNVSMPSMFDASGGDGLPSSAAITASLTSSQPWTVSIVTVDSASSVVQSFSGNSANINVSWNGKNASGVEVADDAYEVDISYGGGNQPAIKGALIPHGAPPPGIIKGLIAKNRTGDCFVFFDQAVFPSGYADMIAYLKAIKADLASSQGNVWQKFSFIIHTTRQPIWTANQIQRIDNHFKMPLSVFYVDSHGGPGFYGGSQFSSGGHFWESTAHTYNNPFGHSIMPTLTQSANYGVSTPPALVFIDSCDSAGDSQVQPDLSFANDFDIGDGSSGFIGWGGYAVVYGDRPAPRDDWTFWRLDLWTQFTNFNQTYDTAYSKLQSGYDAHGHNWAGSSGNPEEVVVVDWPTGSLF